MSLLTPMRLNISMTQYPALLGIGIQLKTDASSVLSEVVHTPSHPGNKAGSVLPLYSERLVSPQIAESRQILIIQLKVKG